MAVFLVVLLVVPCQGGEVGGAIPRIGRLKLRSEYWEWTKEAGAKYGVDPCLIVATAAVESRFDASATSGRGSCIGLMQLHKDTARSLGVDPWNPRENIEGGAQVLARLLRKYHGNLRRVYWTYNAKCNEGYFREVMKAYHQAVRTLRGSE
jgi:soluble lytic murein transglycosylase-like protein